MSAPGANLVALEQAAHGVSSETGLARLTGRRPVLPNLTGVRIFAALYVLVYHLFSRPVPGRPWYDAWVDGGYLGVSLFFVLSGFILAYNAPDAPDTRKFYVLRVARVYPLYLAALVWGLPNFLRHGAVRGAVVIPADLLLLQTWLGPNYAIAINPPSWSLSTEAFFYLMFPWVLPLLRRGMRRWRMMLGVLALLAIGPAVLTEWVLAAHARTMAGTSELILGLPLFRLAEFAVGVVLGLRFADRLPRIGGRQTALATVLSVSAIGVFVGHVPFPIVRTGLFALPFGWLLYCLAGWRSRFLASAPMQLLGEISYGVYLLQIPLLDTVGVLAPGGPHHDAFVKWLLSLLILPVAYVFYVAVEKPGRTLILRWFGVRSHAKPIQTPQRDIS